MIERLWELLTELVAFAATNFDPWRDILDIAIVTFAIYWLLLLIRGTRAIQILVGMVVLITISLAADVFSLLTTQAILGNFLSSAVVIIVVLFQHDIRRALARVGRGFFPAVSPQQESQIIEEVVRAAQTLADRRVGALIVLERETGLSDQIEAGTVIDAAVSKELLTTIFLQQSPLHDGAAMIQNGRVASAGCILPLTLKSDLPEGVGTRHRAAVGITEETDALVVVVSEETSAISVVMSGDILQGLDGPHLRSVLSEIMSGKQRDLFPVAELDEDALAEDAQDAPVETKTPPAPEKADGVERIG
jgi:diadenylate cyclase